MIREVPGEERRSRSAPQGPARASAGRAASFSGRIRGPCLPSRKCSSPTAARSPSASSARCASSASCPVAVYSDADRGRAARARRRRGVPDRAGALRRELPPRRRHRRDRARARAPRRSIPGYGFLAENAALRPGGRGRRPHVDRPAAGGDRADGLDKTAARAAMRAAGVPIIPGTTEPVTTVEAVLELGEEIGYPLIVKATAGGGGKGMKLVRRARGRRAGVRRPRSARARSTSPTTPSTSSGTSRTRVTSRRRCSPTRTAPCSSSASATARSSGATRSSSRRRPSPAVDDALRARIGDDRRRRGAGGRLPVGGDDRGPAHRGRRLLLHGDEHADPGRAHGHRDGHGHRPRARAGARSRRASRLSLRQEDVVAPRARDRVPDQRRGRRGGVPAGAGADHRVPTSLPGLASASTPVWPPGTRSRASTTR